MQRKPALIRHTGIEEQVAERRHDRTDPHPDHAPPPPAMVEVAEVGELAAGAEVASFTACEVLCTCTDATIANTNTVTDPANVNNRSCCPVFNGAPNATANATVFATNVATAAGVIDPTDTTFR